MSSKISRLEHRNELIRAIVRAGGSQHNLRRRDVAQLSDGRLADLAKLTLASARIAGQIKHLVRLPPKMSGRTR